MNNLNHSIDIPISRIAVIGSPRSGNSWIRSVIAGSLNMQEIAVHNYKDVPIDIPERCFLQIHWYREPNFQRWLADHRFAKLCVARHPLDILLSVLHYIRYEPGTARWLEGNAEIPSKLACASPVSTEFLEYALSYGAENLLSISYQWWQDKSIFKLRYEDCVLDPKSILGRQIQIFGGDPKSASTWLQHLSLENMKATHNRHGWQGCPGLYKKLIPPLHALKIYKRHKRVFDIMGYGIEPYFITYNKAIKNWTELL